MRIRKAKISDFNVLYKIGRSTPELKVSKNEIFMTPTDFKFAIANRNGIFLVAIEADRIIAFSYCAIEGPDYACLVYNVVLPKYRGKGIGGLLIKKREQWLKRRRIKSVYSLATNPNVARILAHLGYKKGKTLTWMEKRL
ncbi:MAG: GNAT family N-acetyltransferase [Candidatus Micrarchaeota archaeon]|nr:GNAT family N-acetyltransferase [Candidatus Micrarchaeota archaeon]